MSYFNCPNCGTDRTGVVDSRCAKGHVRRRRRCPVCQHRFTTYETVKKPDKAATAYKARHLQTILESVVAILDEVEQ